MGSAGPATGKRLAVHVKEKAPGPPFDTFALERASLGLDGSHAFRFHAPIAGPPF
jgi:hypothetical protein